MKNIKYNELKSFKCPFSPRVLIKNFASSTSAFLSSFPSLLGGWKNAEGTKDTLHPY
jgi:hypothetical protein